MAWVQERDRLPESDQGTCKHLNFIHILCMLYIQGTLVDQPLAEGTPSQQCAMETSPLSSRQLPQKAIQMAGSQQEVGLVPPR